MAASHEIFLDFWTFLALFVIAVVGVTSGELCDKTGLNACSCKNSKGTIDLTKLSSASTGQPRWSKVASTKDQYLYSYDPCSPFTEPPATLGGCTGVLACATGKSKQLPLADPTKDWSTVGEAEKDTLTFQYQYLSTQPPLPMLRKLHVELHCSNEEGRLEVVGEDPPGQTTYRMKLYSVHACYNGVYPYSGGVSFGTVLCILFFLCLGIYLIGGFLFLTYARQARGAERFPHVEFWRDFPHLVRDGAGFLFRGCKVETTYDRI